MINLLDVVALVQELPERGLQRGQVGTVVEVLPPDVFEVEFSDTTGRTYASLAVKASAAHAAALRASLKIRCLGENGRDISIQRILNGCRDGIHVVRYIHNNFPDRFF